MPALPAVPGVVKVTIPMQVLGDSSALNRFYVHYSGTAPTSAQLATFCDAVSTAWGANIAALCNNFVTQNPIQAEDLSSSTGAVAGGTTSHPGTRGGTPLPAATCGIIEFKIARRYRGGKPKIFLPVGITGDLSSTGVWGATQTAAWGTGWAAFIAAVLAAGWAAAGTLTHVNVSYYLGNTPVQNPVTHRYRNVPTLRGAPVVDAIVSYAVETGVGSQRRRNVI